MNEAEDGSAEGKLRSLSIARPQGSVENSSVIEQCSAKLFATPRSSPFQESRSGESCPVRTQVGIITLRGSFPGGTRTFGLFSLVPEARQAALVGARPFGQQLKFASRVQNLEGAFALKLASGELPASLGLSGMTITQWGNPWLASHDLQRGNCLNEEEPAAGFGEEAILDPEPRPIPSKYKPGTCSTGNPAAFPPLAYLTLPTSCQQGQTEVVALSGEIPAEEVRASQQLQVDGCETRFQAIRTRLNPLGDRASSPAGLKLDVDVNQENLTKNVTEAGRTIPSILAASQLRQLTVRLPDGFSINPSVAAGLAVCRPSQYAAEAAELSAGTGCPPESKIGRFSLDSPLFSQPLIGGLFIATPYDNPSSSLLGLYLVARASERGVFVKLAGRIDPDPATGRLEISFDQLPQLPYSHLEVNFREGQRAPYASPRLCGSYDASVDAVPWVDRETVLTTQAAFQLIHGPGGGPCPPIEAPFAPAAVGGSYGRAAGAYTPFYLKLTRTDLEQEITAYSAVLPPGLLGRITGIAYCPEAAIAAADANSGFAETSSPSCPEASRIGRTVTGYGVGSTLAYAPGNLYLAGPYHGSPLSVVAVDSATVGPFDLGVIIVRSAIRVDPHTAQVSIDSAGSDPIPHIRLGIPLHVRDIRIYINRGQTMVNPTSCNHLSIRSILRGSGPQFADPADDTTASTETPYQAAFCSSLGFSRISMRLKGGTKRGGFPALTTTVTTRSHDANIARASVQLPASLFLEQAHIVSVCSRVQAAANRCPPGSTYGIARAITPLLDEPLEGPVIMRASESNLPDLVAELSGRGIHIELVGRIDSKGGGMRATFEGLPDAPLTKFTFTLRGGKKGLLANSDDICHSPPATARLLGQNSRGVILKPRLINRRCRHRASKKGER